MKYLQANFEIIEFCKGKLHRFIFRTNNNCRSTFHKLTDKSFVLIDNPKSPKFSTRNPFSFAIVETLTASRSKVSVGVME